MICASKPDRRILTSRNQVFCKRATAERNGVVIIT
jgi:hypothetical protein